LELDNWTGEAQEALRPGHLGPLCININHFQPYSPKSWLKKIGRQAFLDLINDNARSLGLHSESAADAAVEGGIPVVGTG